MRKTADIFRFKDYVCTPGTGCACVFCEQDSPLHRHEDFYEITLVTQGSFTNVYNGERTVLARNDLMFYKAGEQHSILLNEEKGMVLNFLIEEETFKKYSVMFGYEEQLGKQNMTIRKL